MAAIISANDLRPVAKIVTHSVRVDYLVSFCPKAIELMFVGGEGGNGGDGWMESKNRKKREQMPARCCNWIRFWAAAATSRGSRIRSTDVPYRVAGALINQTGQSHGKSHVTVAAAPVLSLHHLCRHFGFFVRSCTHHWPRADFVSSAAHCYFNLLQQQRSARTTQPPFPSIISHFARAVFLWFFAPHSHFISAFCFSTLW